MKVMIVDDDAFFCSTISGIITDLKCEVNCYGSLEEFETVFPKYEPDFLIIDLAIPTENSTLVSPIESKGGHDAGVAALRKIKPVWQRTKIALITGGPSAEAKKWCNENDVYYVTKPIDRSQLEHFLGIRGLRAFVVHGRDMVALKKAKLILKSIDIEPIVLMEMPNLGRTVIEKFEEVATICDIAVVILSSDDVGGLKGTATTELQARSRQNVVFELGYFCGALRRDSGKVIVLEFGKTEIPSDIAGIVRVDGKKSKKRLVDEIQKEIL
jgi:CheY-like chemotaxis protein